jgi:integrase
VHNGLEWPAEVRRPTPTKVEVLQRPLPAGRSSPLLGQFLPLAGDDEYGTHTMRRIKATWIYRRAKNLRAVQLLLGHSKLGSTVRYPDIEDIEVEDALEISERTEL